MCATLRENALGAQLALVRPMLRCVPILTLSLALALTAVACAGYKANSFRTGAIWGGHRFEGTRLSRGCLDIALRAKEQFTGEPTIDVSIGNRCPEALHVDLGKLRIRGHFDGAAPKQLALFDPRGEIREALLGGNSAASERLEIFGAQGAYELCVSVDAIVATRNSGPPHETCIPVEAVGARS